MSQVLAPDNSADQAEAPDLVSLAGWAAELEPTAEDIVLADRPLLDTIAVTVAAQGHPVAAYTRQESAALRWAAVGHVLDFDDVHLPSTSHVSVVCVAATLASGGGAREYLAGAGVFARIGAALGWSHYARGWHATCTAGAPAAAVCAGLSMGLDIEGLTRAMALAVPAAGGVQAAFGAAGKSLQVGFTADAGVRAARLAAAGASANPGALQQWFDLVGGEGPVVLPGPVIPDGLAIKLHPCCYALQRPIGTARLVREQLVAAGGDPVRDVAEIEVGTPAATLQPLITALPTTGLEGKFSLPYSIATALLDDFPGLIHFTDDAVDRPGARALMDLVTVRTTPDETGILAGDTTIRVRTHDGSLHRASLDLPPGHPGRPPSAAELDAKVAACLAGPGSEYLVGLTDLSWASAADLLTGLLPADPAG